MTRRRKAAIAVAVCLLAVVAGCSAFTDEPDRDRLGEDVDYEWNGTANATYDVQPNEYHATVRIDGTDEVELWRPGDLGGEEPLPARGIAFRYPNGTVVGLEAFEVERTRDALIVGLPAERGQFAYTVESGSRSVFVPVIGTGSHEVVLPPGMRTDVPILGDVDPGGAERSLEGERVHLRWSDTPDAPIYVQYYLHRDIYIFGGAAAILAVVAALGLVYYRIQIRRLEERREEAGLDLER